MGVTGPAGWDAQNCWKAVQSVRQGGDPYAEGIAAQQAFHNRPASSAGASAPLTYVYSPLTLSLLRLLALLPDWLLRLLFWSAIAGGFFLQLWAGFQLANAGERRWLALLLPAVAFFPGLITDDVILSGNVAYIIYGPILAAAVYGWKRNRWLWYYVAVLAASICKAPFLTMLAFPVLVGKRQWLSAAGTAAAGLLVIAAQARLWPTLFSEYLTVLRLMFEEAHDFGYGPAGVVGKALWKLGLPYSSATTIVYLGCAALVGLGLLFVSRRVGRDSLAPEISLRSSEGSLRENWIPVALVGTFLLNPRIMKYDMAALTVPMLLIGWRLLRNALERAPQKRTLILAVAASCFIFPNLITVAGPAWWPVELAMMVGILGMGIVFLNRTSLVFRWTYVAPGTALPGHGQPTLLPARVTYDEVVPIPVVEPII
jgi:hypothetical protein